MELKSAIEQNKQVYIFVERDVLAEHRTYSQNRDAAVKWVSVDDPAIFKFLDEIFALPNNNPVMPFDTSHDILALLREQWAGLFQRLLQQASAETQFAAARELRQGIETVRRLVEILTASAGDAQQAAKDAIFAVLAPNHPIFARLQGLLKVPYRVFFTNLDELNRWLKNRNFSPVEEELWDDPKHREWMNDRSADGMLDLLKIDDQLFDPDGRLLTDVKWDDDLVRREIRQLKKSEDDEPPF